MVKLLAIQKLPESFEPSLKARSLCFFFSKKNGCLFAYTAPCMLPGFQLLASGIDLLISPGEQWTNHDRELKIQVKCNRQSKRWIEKEEIAIQNKINLQSNHKDLNFSTATAIQKQKRKEEPQSRCFLNRWATKRNLLLSIEYWLFHGDPYNDWNPLVKAHLKGWIENESPPPPLPPPGPFFSWSSDVGILWLWFTFRSRLPIRNLPIVYGWSIRDTPGGPERIFWGKKTSEVGSAVIGFWSVNHT